MINYVFSGMGMFAQFFISPLLRKEAMTREREAIDSEFKLVLNNDECRKEQIIATAVRKGCPLNAFAWGNADTLKPKNVRRCHFSTMQTTT